MAVVGGLLVNGMIAMTISMYKKKPKVSQVRPYRERQQELMAFIRYYVAETGAFPTQARISRQMEWASLETARHALERLVVTGDLRRERVGNGYRYEIVERKTGNREEGT